MCLILFSYQPDTLIPFVLGANRDEYFERPTLAADFWPDAPHILAGRDQVSGGTWIGITQSGRFAALTNIREPSPKVDNRLSRGELTKAFLTGTQSGYEYLKGIKDSLQQYDGFNLLVGEFNSNRQSLFYLNNREQDIQQLAHGTYGLSNHRLDTPWPKVIKSKHALDQTIAQNTLSHKSIRAFLEDPELAEDSDLPKTGVTYEQEKALSASFIETPHYGTRASTVITIQNGTINFSEKSYREDQYKEYSIVLR